ncbi:MAG: hypothetical protein ACKOUD_01355 [Rhodoluna sp.]
MTEFQSRRELREAERQGLVQKPEQVFDLPTGQINLPNGEGLAAGENVSAVAELAPEIPAVGEMLTRKRIREMERQGLLDPLTGALPVAQTSPPAVTGADVSAQRAYDEVLAETEEPITASINAVIAPAPVLVAAPAAPVAPTDIFHNMAIDSKSRTPWPGIIIGSIVLVLAGLAAAAYMLGIFK